MIILTFAIFIGTFTVTSKQLKVINKDLEKEHLEKITKSMLSVARYYTLVGFLILCGLAFLLSKLWKACRETKDANINRIVWIFLILFLIALGVGVYSE